jgi:carboxyl-terminal processing protease
MEMPATSARPGGAEQAARAAVVLFLVLAAMALLFAFGFYLGDHRDDGKRTFAAPAGTNGEAASAGVGAAAIDEIVNLLKNEYVDRKNVDPNQLKDAAIAGMIESLNDRETSYVSPADLKAGALQLSATYQGIGATVSDRSGAIVIVAPFRDSPAEQAGIRSGDVILEVDGEPTDGWTDSLAVERIRGLRGTPVTLKVRHSDGTTEEITIVRGDIDIQSVFDEPNLEVIPGESDKKIVDRTGAEAKDICYLSISQFHEKTVGELRQRGKDIESRGCKGLVLDVRSNPGGGLQATVDVADEFLNTGKIIIERDADGKERTTDARPGGILTKIPIVVLQDRGSASGSEVLAAALRDNGRAVIIGTTSFGKGTVNRLFPLTNCGKPNECGAVYMSIGRWLTPKGELIEGLGVKPDIELPMTSEEYIDQGDIQLFRAIEYIRTGK